MNVRPQPWFITIRRHSAGILRWLRSRISNGTLEAMNSLVQAAKVRSRRDEELKVRIRETWTGSRETYGRPRVHAALAAEGVRASRRRVARLMRELDIRGVTRRRFRTGTTKRDPVAAPAPDREQMNVRPRPWFVRTAAIPVVGLLVAAGLVSDARPTLAQSQGNCVLSADVAPPEDPRVTAQQVEDGSASLMDFALAVREQYRALSREIATFEGEAYFGCLIRQDGSPYRSGSTFLVSLAPDGSVLAHSTAMRLSGRKLNPLIFGAIFRALGAMEFADLIDVAQSEGGSFDVPDIPGASGYATVYLSPGLGVPVILLAGFDLNETHLAEEALDYGDPAITASDVVDRETLKAFVAEAARYLIELGEGETGGRSAIWRAKHAMRDPNGPWRQGSVYLYVLDLSSNLIMFHGAFPDRYEFLPMSVTVRDAVTGELVLPQLVEAAKRSSEGGFVVYFFDDPADDNDSADIPKVGYARVFTGLFRDPSGGFSRSEFVVGSGVY